jgi:hypothetical protein
VGPMALDKIVAVRVCELGLECYSACCGFEVCWICTRADFFFVDGLCFLSV